MTRIRRPQRARTAAALAVAALGALILAPSSALAATDFPRGYEGYHTYAEIGTLLQVSEGTVRMRISRGRAAFRSAYGGGEDGDASD